MREGNHEQGRPRALIGTWLSQPSPVVAEAFARSGMDWTVLDLQHGSFDLGSAATTIQLLDVLGLEVYARMPITEIAQLPRLLDHGLTGGIVANIRSPEEVVTAISHARYQDEGVRSFTSQRFGLKRAPADIHALRPPVYVIIETLEALENLEAIAAVPGLAGFVLGPNDLSMAMGLQPAEAADSARWRDALDHVLDVALTHGLEGWAWAGDGADAATFVQKGWHRVSVGTDITALRAGLSRELAIARGDST